MRRHLMYGWYVLRHKWFVFLACLQYGLIWRGIVHDLSKFSPREWFPYACYFYAPDGTGRFTEKARTGYAHVFDNDDTAFNHAWNHHQKRNPHHWQYYVLNLDDGGVQVLKMPDADMKEMLCDWRGTGRTQGKPKTWEWYAVQPDWSNRLHPETRAWIEAQLDEQKRDYEQRERLRTLGVIS